MASLRPFVFALLGALTIAVVTPAHAQSTKPGKTKSTKTSPARTQRQMNRQSGMSDGMSGGTMAPSTASNTAATQANIDRANKSLSDMVALLDQIEARKKTP